MARAPKVKAMLLYHSKVQLIHRESEEVAVAELKVWEVPKDKNFPEGIKYSMFLIDKQSGKVIFGFDNHKPKGPHKHFRNEETSHEFKSVDALIDEFWAITSKEGYLV